MFWPTEASIDSKWRRPWRCTRTLSGPPSTQEKLEPGRKRGRGTSSWGSRTAKHCKNMMVVVKLFWGKTQQNIPFQGSSCSSLNMIRSAMCWRALSGSCNNFGAIFSKSGLKSSLWMGKELIWKSQPHMDSCHMSAQHICLEGIAPFLLCQSDCMCRGVEPPINWQWIWSSAARRYEMIHLYQPKIPDNLSLPFKKVCLPPHSTHERQSGRCHLHSWT